ADLRDEPAPVADHVERQLSDLHVAPDRRDIDGRGRPDAGDVGAVRDPRTRRLARQDGGRGEGVIPLRHGRACPGHPRLTFPEGSKSWMPGTRPGMTECYCAASATFTPNTLWANCG